MNIFNLPSALHKVCAHLCTKLYQIAFLFAFASIVDSGSFQFLFALLMINNFELIFHAMVICILFLLNAW